MTHHQSQFIYKGDKKGFLEAGAHYEPLNLIEGTPAEMLDFTQVLAGPLGAAGGVIPGSITSGQPGTATTTTTTTVVVTHGNGETETIIDGDNLPPGTNEMIMTAAAAAFPLDCFPGGLGTATTGSVEGTTTVLPGQLQVQLSQVPVPVQVPPTGITITQDLSPLTTTTMHTTTIINSSGTATAGFQPQILLPHPPPLPQAIAAAAAAAGLIPPSGAPPDGALRHQQHFQQTPQQQKQAVPAATTIKGQITKEKCVQQQQQQQASSATKPSSQVSSSGTQVQQHAVPAQPVPKKQVAKRTRPFCQQQPPHQHPQVSSAKGM